MANIAEVAKDKVTPGIKKVIISVIRKALDPKFDDAEYKQVTSKTFSKWLLAKVIGQKEVVGVMGIFDKKKYGMFGLLCVLDEYRGRGIATHLIRKAKNEFNELQWTTLRPLGDDLKRFYESQGGKIYKMVPTPDGKVLDYWIWKRQPDPEYYKSFMMVGNVGLYWPALIEILTKHGWKQVEAYTKGHPMYLHFEPYYNTKQYDRDYFNEPKCGLKSILPDNEKAILVDKVKLHVNMKNAEPQVYKEHLAKSYVIEDKKDIDLAVAKIGDCKTPYIIKPTGKGALGGIGIAICSKQDLRALIDKSRFKQFLISEYIDNPMLFEGRKFHIRRYMLVIANGKKLKSDWKLWKRGKIMTAKLPYQQSNYHNPDIHDTHMKSTDDNYFTPEHLPDRKFEESFEKQTSEICSGLFHLVSDIKSVPEADDAYEIFALDLLPDDKGNLYLLEVNEKVGYLPADATRPKNWRPEKKEPEAHVRFSYDRYQFIYDNVVSKIE
jgi:GNAT superfamily N-acetyltransferase